MEVREYKSPDGNWFREMIESRQAALLELRDAYRKKGLDTWMNPYDGKKWMLTVCLGSRKSVAR